MKAKCDIMYITKKAFLSCKGLDNMSDNRRERLAQLNMLAAKFYYCMLFSDQGKECLSYYMNQRQLKPDTIKRYQLGYAPDRGLIKALTTGRLPEECFRSMQKEKFHNIQKVFTTYCSRIPKPTVEELHEARLVMQSQKDPTRYYEFFRNRAAFPLIDVANNRVVGFSARVLPSCKDDPRKYVNTPATPLYKKEKFLFSMYNAAEAVAKEKHILICEGNVDAVSLWQAGFKTAVASCGTAFTHEQAELISMYTDTVLVCFDNDSAGRSAVAKSIKTFQDVGIENILVVDMTAYVEKNGEMVSPKDPDDFIKLCGKEEFQNRIDQAVHYAEYLIAGAKDDYLAATSAEGTEEQVEFNRLYQICAGILRDIPDPAEQMIYTEYAIKLCGFPDEQFRRTVNADTCRSRSDKANDLFEPLSRGR